MKLEKKRKSNIDAMYMNTTKKIVYRGYKNRINKESRKQTS